VVCSVHSKDSRKQSQPQSRPLGQPLHASRFFSFSSSLYKAPFGAREFRRNFTGLDSSGNFSYSCVRFVGFGLDYSVGKSRSPVLFTGKITSTQTKGNARRKSLSLRSVSLPPVSVSLSPSLPPNPWTTNAGACPTGESDPLLRRLLPISLKPHLLSLRGHKGWKI
jgi:hypothetical protein